MKSKLGIFAMLLPIALLTIYPNDLNAQPGEELKNETPWHCKGKCRTWVVYESADHMVTGDKFQIQQLGQNVKFVALSKLKGNWKKDVMNPFEPDLTQIGGPKFGPNSRLCGFVDIVSDEHEPDSGIGHMFKINLKNKNTLQITWKPAHSESVKNLDPDKRNAMCEAVTQSHGGVAHAEPN